MAQLKTAEDKKFFSDLIRRTQVSAKISRLFAQENISVEYSADAETASFDVVRRVLIYPYSLVLEDELIHDLLMGHEIGHARFTKTAEEMRLRAEEGVFEYWNIIEDARIEKLMKRDYPGLRITFQNGYLRLFQKGWFGSEQRLSIGTFATRLNFFCKAGPITAHFIRFNDEEKEFLRRVEEVELEEDVHALAVEMAKMAGKDPDRARELLMEHRRTIAIERAKWRKFTQMQYENHFGQINTDEEGEDEEFDEESIEENIEENIREDIEQDIEQDKNKDKPVVESRKKNTTAHVYDKDMRPNTDDFGNGGSITKKQAEWFIPELPTDLTDEEVELTEEDRKWIETITKQDERVIEEVIEFDPLEKFNANYAEQKIRDARMVVYESIDRKDVNTPDARKLYEAFIAQYVETPGHYWHGQSNTLDYLNESSIEARQSLKKAVDYLARQFDAKKAAIRSKNAVISTSGHLDINRVFAYKYSEDVFKKKINVRDAKNHGVVLLLDASGSIATYWRDMVKQVLLITEFCKKVQIPFKVFIFGHQIEIRQFDQYRPRPVVDDKNEIATHPMLGWGRDHDSAQEVLSSEMTAPEYRTMVGALLDRAFFEFGGTPTTNAILNIEANINEFFLRHNVTIKKMFVITDGGASDGLGELKEYGTRVFVTDPKTRKSYYVQMREEYYHQTPVDIVVKIFKDRYGIDTTYLALGMKKDVQRIDKRRGKIGMAKSFGLINAFEGEELKAAYRKNNFMLKHTPLGIPVFFVKPTKAETELDFRGEVWDAESHRWRPPTTKEIAAEFAAGMSSLKTSQTFLSILMQHIAVEIED